MDEQQVNPSVKLPETVSEYPGEYVVFYADEEAPEVLFHHVVPDEAYKKAEELQNTSGKRSFVFRVPEDNSDSISVSIKRRS